jgi:hypothetical protein
MVLLALFLCVAPISPSAALAVEEGRLHQAAKKAAAR